MAVNKTGIPLHVAARQLFEYGYTVEQVQAFLAGMKKPTEGYVYAADVSKLAPEGFLL